MPNPRKYYMTGLLLEFFALKDLECTAGLTYASKKITNEALFRLLRSYPIPHPWEGESLE